MFKSVENELEFAMFNGIWTTVWTEKGFELEFSEEFLERYVVVTEEGHYVGSIEIKPYGEESLMNEIGPFLEHPLIQAEMGNIAEIDKLAILSTFRGRYVTDLLSAIVHYAEMNQISYYAMLLEPVLMRALRISYHVPVQKIGGRVFYKGEDVIPAIVNAREVYTHKEQFPWLVPSEKAAAKTSI